MLPQRTSHPLNKAGTTTTNLMCHPFPLQVARQQGEYLAEALRLADGQLGSLDELAPPFRYSHKGSMAYVGGGEWAALQLFFLWRASLGGRSGRSSSIVQLACRLVYASLPCPSFPPAGREMTDGARVRPPHGHHLTSTQSVFASSFLF